MNPIKILVVDDTIIFRKIVSDVISEIPEATVVGTANNGKIALSKIASLKPDLLTLDIEMPQMDGLKVLEFIQEKTPHVGAIMLSTLTQEGSEMTIRALELGAFDFIPKPQSGTMQENMANVRNQLIPMIKAFSRRREIQNILKGKSAPPVTADSKGPSPIAGTKRPAISRPAAGPLKRSAITKNKIRPVIQRRATFQGAEIVAIGISTGGPKALAQMMPKLPETMNVPIVIVQHMPPLFTQSLAKSLNAKCAIHVKEAVNGEALAPNTALIAPGGKQMKIVASADGTNRIIKITNDPPENSCRPSADYLFRSVAELYLGRSTGVIMTGMGSDGYLGLVKMKEHGSFIIAQDEETCTVFGMPKDPIEANIVDVISPLDAIAEAIKKTIKKGR